MKSTNISEPLPESISSILTKDLTSLTLPQKQNLSEFVAVEKEAEICLGNLANSLKDIASKGSDVLDEPLAISGISSKDKEQVKQIYNKTILKTAEAVTISIFEYLKKGEGVLRVSFLAEKVVNIIESFQAFKARIDKFLPISCDTIMKNAVPVLLVITDSFAPGVSVVLRATSIIEKATEFLQDKNLDIIKEKLKANIKETGKQTGLEVVTKMAELSGVTEIAPTALGAAIGLDPKIIDETLRQVSQQPELVGLIQGLSSYAENILPKTQKDIEQITKTIKDSALDSLKDLNLSKEVTQKIGEELDKSLKAVTKTLSEQISSPKSILDKVGAIQQVSAELLSSCTKEITKIIKDNVPEVSKGKEVVEAFTKGLKNVVKERLQGNVEQIAAKLQDPKVKSFAKSALKAGHASLLDVERGADIARGKSSASMER